MCKLPLHVLWPYLVIHIFLIFLCPHLVICMLVLHMYYGNIGYGDFGDTKIDRKLSRKVEFKEFFVILSNGMMPSQQNLGLFFATFFFKLDLKIIYIEKWPHDKFTQHLPSKLYSTTIFIYHTSRIETSGIPFQKMLWLPFRMLYWVWKML